MTRNINSDAENCQAEVGVPWGPFTPEGASYSGVTCPGGYSSITLQCPMGLTSDTRLSVLSTVWVRRGQVHYPDQRLVHDGPRM